MRKSDKQKVSDDAAGPPDNVNTKTLIR
jgi:hypothetical protein